MPFSSFRTAPITPGGLVRPNWHLLMHSGQVVWCDMCGAHSAGLRVVGLGQVCMRKPANKFASTVLRRLREGRHPASKECLVPPTHPLRRAQGPSSAV